MKPDRIEFYMDSGPDLSFLTQLLARVKKYKYKYSLISLSVLYLLSTQLATFSELSLFPPNTNVKLYPSLSMPHPLHISGSFYVFIVKY